MAGNRISGVSSVFRVNHEQLLKHVKRHYFGKDMPPMFLWGPPGIGKSFTFRHAAKEIADEMGLTYSENPADYGGNDKKFVYNDVRAAQLDPSDSKGLPTFEDDTVVWRIPKFFPKSGQGILSFDELNRAPDIVRSSLYSLLDRGILGDYVKPESWLVVGAGNRLEDRVGVFDMEGTLCNRFAHYELISPDAEYWVNNYAIKHGIDHRIIGYIMYRKLNIYNYDPMSRTEQAFATPRSWEFGSKLISGLPNEEVGVIQAAVGMGIGIEFEQFCKDMNKYDVEKILDGKIDFPTEPSEKYAATASIAEYYQGEKKNLEKIFNYTTKIKEAEFGMLMIVLSRQLQQNAFKKQLSSVLDANKEVSKRYGKFMF